MKFLFFLILSFSCLSQVVDLPSSIYSRVDFSGNFKEDGALVMDVSFEAISKLRESIDKEIGSTLSHRGEAHITLLTPPDMNVLKNSPNQITIDQIHKEFSSYIQDIEFEVDCLGYSSEAAKEVYYVVIKENKAFYNIRRKIKEMSGGNANFDPYDYDPHITVGYINGDVYSQGKRADSCDRTSLELKLY